ncbi:hypothetical protein T440DRAFT_86989 [Plenodomus tracheiphilus IPT5]|uniref:JmjC domain-containing protein n=1 Tax=Plenodomus tracheiphilus IPT5 TaxID=1408161 RepID=A0A6A7ALW2_9PLEO|nr:hypothetical protein T440DRAFT_86989 [Plenodomus tracheiphilus IPT5]
MVATIQQARTALRCHNFDERRYLIPQVQKRWDASELAQLLRGAEDGNTASANLLVAGAEKHWIIVHRSSAKKLERYIRDQFPASRGCSQLLRHHNVIVGPRWLGKNGINYEIVCQKPGDILVTLPGRVYHEVRKTGMNFAVAINYAFADALDDPAYYICFMLDLVDRTMDIKDETPLTHKQKQQESATKKRCKSHATLVRRTANSGLVQTSRLS